MLGLGSRIYYIARWVQVDLRQIIARQRQSVLSRVVSCHGLRLVEHALELRLLELEVFLLQSCLLRGLSLRLQLLAGSPA